MTDRRGHGPRFAVRTGLSLALLAAPALSPGIVRADESQALPPVEEDYVLHCSACHGLDGAGVRQIVPGPDGAGVRQIVPGLGDTGVISRLPGGRDYLMRVPGAAQSPLDDARLARLLDWVVEQFGGVELEPPLSAEAVGEARRRPLRDPVARRRSIGSFDD